MRTVSVRLTINGDTAEGARGAVAAPFTFYDPRAFGVARVHPAGGPSGGATLVTITLIDEALLVDLGGNDGGVRCRFGSSDSGWEAIVRGELSDCRGQRRCGGGRGAIQCRAPPYTGGVDTASATASVSLSISVNGGQHYAESLPQSYYLYYVDTAWLIDGLEPTYGSVAGNTSVLVRAARRLEDLGDVRCRFGALNTAVDGTVDSEAGGVRCISPAHWAAEQLASEVAVPLEVTLNGQDFLSLPPAAEHLRRFVYRDADLAARECRASRWAEGSCRA